MRGSVRASGRIAGALAVVVAMGVVAQGAVIGAAGAEAVARPTAAVDKSATLRFGLAIADQGGSSFDPATMPGNPANVEWMDLMYDVMIHDTRDGKGSPGLATKWSAVDASTAELTLRSGVKFSDGTAFDAAAVKAAWDRVVAAAETSAPPEVKVITGIDAVGDNVVRVHFSQPVAQTFLDTTVHHSAYLGVPSPAAVAAGTLGKKPVGAGPYLLKDFVQDQQVTLAKNPQYWNPKAQRVAGFAFTQAATGTPAVSALQAGTVDLIYDIPSESIQTVKNTPGLEVTAVPGTRVLDLSLCATSGVFASKDARVALQYALDRDSINEGAYNGVALPWQTAIGSSSPFYNKKLNHKYSFNVKKAKQLLKKAGVAPGTTVSGLANGAAPQPTIAEIVQQQFKKVGLNLKFTVTTNFVDDATRLKPDVLFVALDPGFWGSAFTQTSVLNVCGWSNPQVTADLNGISDPTKTVAQRKQSAGDFQQTLLDESPIVVTVLTPATIANTTKVKGITTIATPYGPNLNTVYVTK